MQTKKAGLSYPAAMEVLAAQRGAQRYLE